MNRRNFLKGIAVVPVVAIVPKDLELALPETIKTTEKVYSPKFAKALWPDVKNWLSKEYDYNYVRFFNE